MKRSKAIGSSERLKIVPDTVINFIGLEVPVKKDDSGGGEVQGG